MWHLVGLPALILSLCPPSGLCTLSILFSSLCFSLPPSLPPSFYRERALYVYFCLNDPLLSTHWCALFTVWFATFLSLFFGWTCKNFRFSWRPRSCSDSLSHLHILHCERADIESSSDLLSAFRPFHRINTCRVISISFWRAHASDSEQSRLYSDILAQFWHSKIW